MINILNNTTFLLILHLPQSINIGLCRPLLFLSLCTCTLSFGLVVTRRHFSSWLAAHKFIFDVFLSQNSLGGVVVQDLLTPPPVMLPLFASPFHSVFWHLQYPAVSSPSCTCSILERAPEFLLPHAYKCSPNPVLALCIHFRILCIHFL